MVSILGCYFWTYKRHSTALITQFYVKLYAMGIDPTWFVSYLTKRKQIVYIDGVFSDYLDITCRVPQGSLLGPVLYLCYSNDIELSVSSEL